MPRFSDRQALLQDVTLVVDTLAICGDGDTKDFEQLMQLKATILSCRFLNLRKYLAKDKSMNKMFLHYGSKDFKQVVRVEKSSFLRILSIISDDEVFKNKSKFQ